MSEHDILRRRSFSPLLQPDEIDLASVLNAITRNGTIPLDEVIARLDAQNLPPQLVQSQFLAIIPGSGLSNAQLLLPKNPKRMSFLVANPNAANGFDGIVFAYDKPLAIVSSTSVMGVPIGENSYFTEANGSISINDIWVAGSLAAVNASFTASITGTVMTVTVTASGTIIPGQWITGAGVAANTQITSNGTGTGGDGTYNLNISQNVGGEAMTASNYPLYVLGYEGALAITGNPPPPGERDGQW